MGKKDIISEIKKKLQSAQKKTDSNKIFMKDIEERQENNQKSENDTKEDIKKIRKRIVEIEKRQRKNICIIGVPKEEKKNETQLFFKILI